MLKERKLSNSVVRLIIVLSIAISIVALYFFLSAEKLQKPLAGQGTFEDNVPIGGDFELVDQDSKIFSSNSLKGKLALVYFGFTYCPDICPTSLQKLTEVLNTLEKYQIDVTPVFITIDPERDTTNVLKEYLGHFHPKFIGLTGTTEQIKKVADKFKVYYVRSQGTTNQLNNYMLDHSSFVYLMDKNGKYLKHFYMNSTPHEIVEFIRVNK